MSLQMPVTEDTPPDMLSGAMDLNVILPNGSVIKMSVERSTPMMDLLVQITTAHKLSPGSHAIHAIGDRGVLPYKPSTPIGALDTWTVNIVPKSSSKNGRYQSQSSIIKCITKPFEQTFRLQVHLPRNQLYVARISPKTLLNSILKQVCFEKNLDPAKYTLRKPDKLNEPLDLSKSLVDYKLQQLTLVSNTNRALIGGLSSDDIMSRAPKRFSCDDSLSSGSLGGRSLSPTRSDESSDTPPHPLRVKVLPSRPVRKRRLAPKPPSQQRNAPEQTIISHSRNSSDSSGYHESSVLSDAVDCCVGIVRPGKFSPSKTSGGPSMSRSMTNLQACGQNQNQFSEIPFTSNNIGQSKHFASTTSLTSIQSRKKKAAPPPPLVNKPKLAPPQEESESEPEVQRKSQTLPVTAKPYMSPDAQEKSKTVSRIELNNNLVEPNLSPATSSLSSLSRSDVDRGSTADEEDELRMDDEEIDRIFGDATSGYDTPSIVTVRENGGATDVTEIDWEYKLPDPPSAFRDDDRSPTVTMFDTVTIGDLLLKDAAVVQFDDGEPSAATAAVGTTAVASQATDDGGGGARDESVKKIIGDEYHCFPQDSGVGSDDSSLPSSCEEKLHADDKPTTVTAAAAAAAIKGPATAAAPDPPSKLNNFKIVAYDEDCRPGLSRGPAEIFCDESVRTWKTTQMARESNPAYRLQQRAATGAVGVNRHKSFTTADDHHHHHHRAQGNGFAPVKRSTSHISVLSGNITPSNRLSKHYYALGRTYYNSTERLNGYGGGHESPVKRSFSVDDITEDAQESGQDDDYEKEIIPKKIEPTLEQSSPLHSLQILKTILPQIEEHKPKENTNSSFDAVPSDTAALQPKTGNREPQPGTRNGEYAEHVDPWRAVEAEPQKPEAVATEPRIVDRSIRSHPAESDGRVTTAVARTKDDCDVDETVTSAVAAANKRYSYGGPPRISLSTWNERPKRQVSIKTDRDYVIGIRQRMQQKTDEAVLVSAAAAAAAAGATAEPTTKSKDSSRASETGGGGGGGDDRSSAEAVSRVPVVKSVELKKPYAELQHLQQQTAANPVLALAEVIKAQAKLSNGYGGYLHRGGGYRGNVVATAARGDCENATTATVTAAKPSDNNGGSSYTFGKLMTNRPRRPREISGNVMKQQQDPRQGLLESIRSFGGRDNLRKIRG